MVIDAKKEERHPARRIACNWRRFPLTAKSRAVLKDMAAEWLRLAEVAD